MHILRQSSAVTIPVGPFIYRSGVTTMNTLLRTDLYSGSIGAMTGGNAVLYQSATSTVIYVRAFRHMGGGYYSMALTGATVATAGTAKIGFKQAGSSFLPFWEDLFIQAYNPYNAFVSAVSRIQVDLRETHAGVTLVAGTYTGVSVAGRVRVFAINSGGYAGVTIAGVTRIQSVKTSGNTISGFNIIGRVSGNTISGINLIRAGGLAGVTIAGVSRVKSAVPASGIHAGVTISGINRIRAGGLAGVTIAGVTRVALSGIKPGGYSGVTIAGVSRAKSVVIAAGTYAGVTISGVNLAGLKAGGYSGVTIAGVSRTKSINTSGTTISGVNLASIKTGTYAGVTISGVNLASLKAGTYSGVTIGGVTKVFTIGAGVADTIHDEAISGTTTHRQLMRGVAATLFGISSGGGGPAITFRDPGNTKNVIVAAVDADGNRTGVEKDLT